MAVPPDHRTETGFAEELDPHSGRPPAVLRTDFKVLQINDRDLPWVDIFPSNEATTHLKPISAPFLVPGLNTLQIVLNGPALLVYYAVVHWRALEYTPPA